MRHITVSINSCTVYSLWSWSHLATHPGALQVHLASPGSWSRWFDWWSSVSSQGQSCTKCHTARLYCYWPQLTYLVCVVCVCVVCVCVVCGVVWGCVACMCVWSVWCGVWSVCGVCVVGCVVCMLECCVYMVCTCVCVCIVCMHTCNVCVHRGLMCASTCHTCVHTCVCM